MESLEAQAARRLGVPLAELVAELRFLTGCDEQTALELLGACELELHAAVDAYFERQRREERPQRVPARGRAGPPPLPPLSRDSAALPPEQETGFSKRARASGAPPEPEPEPELEPGPEPEPEPDPEQGQSTFRVMGRSILRAGPELQSAVVRELSVGEMLVATDVILLPSTLPPTPSALTDAQLFATATRARIHSADTGGWSSLRANNGTLLLEEVLTPRVSSTAALELPHGLSAKTPGVNFVCTLRSPSMVLANSTGGIAGRVLLHEQRMEWHKASTPTKAKLLGGSRAGGLASSISIPFARIGAVTVGKEKAQQLVFLELQLPRASETSGNSGKEQPQKCLLGPGGRWCLGFGADTQRRSVFLRALGQAIIDAQWVPPSQHSSSTTDSSAHSVDRLIAPEYCGFARCSSWLSIRSRAAMGNVSVELAQEVAHFQAEVAATGHVSSKTEARRLLRQGQGLVLRLRDTIFTQEREAMKSGLLSCPAWQEAGYRTIQGSSPQQNVRFDGFVRLLSIGGGLLPAEPARGRRYLLLRADTAILEMYKERHPEAAVHALASLPLALFQEDDVVSHDSVSNGVASESRSSGTSENTGKDGSTSSRTGDCRSSDVGRASSASAASSGSDIEVVRAPREAIEAGATAAAGLQQDDCWSGSWQLEKVEEVSLAALSTWGQVTLGRDGAPDTLAVVNGAGHAFEMQLPSAAAAARWRTELFAASSGQANANGSGRRGLQSYLARGRRGGISGLSKSGWFWCERGRAGGGKWARRWLELDPDGELRIFNKEAAKTAANFACDGNQMLIAPPPSTLGRGTIVKVDCKLATIRSPKNARKGHPHAFRLEATRGAKNAEDDGQELKFILEPVSSKAGSPSQTLDGATVDETEGISLREEESAASAAYKPALGGGKSVEEDSAEWIEAIRAAGAAAAARSAQRQMTLDDDVDSVLLGTIQRLSEEAVLLPVLEPLLEAAATTVAPAFDNAQQTPANTSKQSAIRCAQSSDEQTLETAAVRWLRSGSAIAQSVSAHQDKQLMVSTDGVQQEEHADEWAILDEETAAVLEAAYQESSGCTDVVVALRIDQISDVGSDINTEIDTAECNVNFATMTLSIIGDDGGEANGSEQSDAYMLQRQDTALHAALRLTGDLSQEHQVFSLRPTYQSPTLWAASLSCFRGLGGGGLVPAAPNAAVTCSGNLALLPGAIEEHLVRLRDQINAQYITERLLPERDPDAAPLPSRVLGADDLLPILCFILARGADVEISRPSHTRLTTLLAWCSAMTDSGGGEGEWMAQAMHSALTHLIENAATLAQATP